MRACALARPAVLANSSRPGWTERWRWHLARPAVASKCSRLLFLLLA